MLSALAGRTRAGGRGVGGPETVGIGDVRTGRHRPSGGMLGGDRRPCRSSDTHAPGEAMRRWHPPVATVLARRRWFARHLLAYAVGNALAVVVWSAVGLATGTWFPWPLLSLAGWGLLVHLHSWWAYGPASRMVTETTLPGPTPPGPS